MKEKTISISHTIHLTSYIWCSIEFCLGMEELTFLDRLGTRLWDELGIGRG